MQLVSEQFGDRVQLLHVGYIVKGVALGVVGGLLSHAALTFVRQKAQGLDGALQTILAQPFGRFLLTAVALDSWPSACSLCSSHDTAGCKGARMTGARGRRDGQALVADFQGCYATTA